MKLIQLIYVSTATDDLSIEDVRRILESSVPKNAANGITGMLLYSHGTFLQVLEGEDSVVGETMTRIAEDPRHHSITVLSKSGLKVREFGNWSMGFRAVGSEDAVTWPGYSPFFESGFDAERIGATPGLALEILTALAEQD